MTTKDAADAAAGIAVVGVLAKWLPMIAAACSIIWFLIRFYEYARVRLFNYPPRPME